MAQYNGTIDIVAVSSEYVTAYDYQGNVLAGWPQQIPDAGDWKIHGLPALGRIAGSDNLQTVIYVGYNYGNNNVPARSRILIYDYDGTLLYTYNASTETRSAFCKGASISDINGDGLEEIAISYLSEGQGYTDIFNRTGLIQTLNWGSCHSIPALADLSYPSDNIPDVISGCYDNSIRAFDLANDQLLWEQTTGGPINSSPAIGDIHPIHDGVEISFGNDRGEIHLREKANGYSIYPWEYTITPGTVVQGSPAIANINGDAYLDIIIVADNQYVYAFKHTRDSIPPFPLPLFGALSPCVIGDIDGDRKSEIILSSGDGYLHVWENKNSRVPPYTMEWPQYHHDYQRTGLYNWVSGMDGGDANPRTFSTATTIPFVLKDTLETDVTVYDAQGNIVRTLVNQMLLPGSYTPVWFGKNDNYSFLPDGLYFIEIEVNDETKIIPVEIDR